MVAGMPARMIEGLLSPDNIDLLPPEKIEGGVGAHSLAELDDVDLSTPPTPGQILKLDPSDSKWRASDDLASTGGGGSSGLFRGTWTPSSVRLVDQPMTSNTTPTPYVASTSGGSTTAYRAFDQVVSANSSQWIQNQTMTWIAVTLGFAKTCTRYQLSHGSPSEKPLAWRLQGSSDNVNWTTLDTQTGVSWPTQTMEYTIANPGAYTYYRLYVDTWQGSWRSISELALWSDSSNLYAGGEYVAHKGRLWRSDVNNNSGEPGTSGWTEIPLGYDRAVTTANRPTGMAAGAHVFDTTLSKPVWWNGTAWVDAAGTLA